MRLSKKLSRPFKGEHLLEPTIEFINSKLDIDIRSSCRETKYSFGRMVFYAISLNYIDVTLPQVAKAIGRHHSSVISSYRNSEQALEDPLYSYVHALALEFVEDLYFGRKSAAQATECGLGEVMKEKIHYLERVIQDLTRGAEFGAYEEHEMAYRALDEEKQEVFRERVNAILKMI